MLNGVYNDDTIDEITVKFTAGYERSLDGTQGDELYKGEYFPQALTTSFDATFGSFKITGTHHQTLYKLALSQLLFRSTLHAPLYCTLPACVSEVAREVELTISYTALPGEEPHEESSTYSIEVKNDPNLVPQYNLTDVSVVLSSLPLPAARVTASDGTTTATEAHITFTLDSDTALGADQGIVLTFSTKSFKDIATLYPMITAVVGIDGSLAAPVVTKSKGLVVLTIARAGDGSDIPGGSTITFSISPVLPPCAVPNFSADPDPFGIRIIDSVGAVDQGGRALQGSVTDGGIVLTGGMCSFNPFDNPSEPETPKMNCLDGAQLMSMIESGDAETMKSNPDNFAGERHLALSDYTYFDGGEKENEKGHFSDIWRGQNFPPQGRTMASRTKTTAAESVYQMCYMGFPKWHGDAHKKLDPEMCESPVYYRGGQHPDFMAKSERGNGIYNENHRGKFWNTYPEGHPNAGQKWEQVEDNPDYLHQNQPLNDDRERSSEADVRAQRDNHLKFSGTEEMGPVQLIWRTRLSSLGWKKTQQVDPLFGTQVPWFTFNVSYTASDASERINR
jgi:hypothetical protein